jgi:hypothetical protein
MAITGHHSPPLECEARLAGAGDRAGVGRPVRVDPVAAGTVEGGSVRARGVVLAVFNGYCLQSWFTPAG